MLYPWQTQTIAWDILSNVRVHPKEWLTVSIALAAYMGVPVAAPFRDQELERWWRENEPAFDLNDFTLPLFPGWADRALRWLGL